MATDILRLGANGQYDQSKLEEWLHKAAGVWCETGRCSCIGTIGTFVTGGWSGNEEIIGAMMENRPAWLELWYSTTRGGKYEFRSYRDEKP